MTERFWFACSCGQRFRERIDAKRHVATECPKFKHLAVPTAADGGLT